MNSYLFIRFENQDKYNIIIKLHKINVKVFAVKEEKNAIIIKILASDYDKIDKYLKTMNVQKIKYTGPLYFKKVLRKYWLVLSTIVCAALLVFFSSHFIVDITVLHNNEKLVDLILDELETYGVKKFHLAKSFDELQNIKDKIRDNNLDKIDWLEITKEGMKYVVRVEERIINSEENIKEYCHVYSTKDGVIKSIKLEEGEMQVDLGDYVKKGDLLVSGDIHLNDEVVGNVCAKANIYAEVWYTVNVKVPLNYVVKEKTGKIRNNILINYNGVDYQLFKNRLNNFSSSKKELFNLLGVKVYLQKDEEVTKNKKKYTIKEAEDKAIKEAQSKIELTLENDEKIISQNVLQKTINDSTIDIDIFIVAEENIATQKEAMLDGDRIT